MGDFALARGWQPEFVGRVIHVKVRGYTVDLEMVESAIGDTGLVVDATVAAVEDAVHGTHLVAYLASVAFRFERDMRASPNVPVYMIPAHFVALEALPLTPTGRSIAPPFNTRRARPEATGPFYERRSKRACARLVRRPRAMRSASTTISGDRRRFTDRRPDRRCICHVHGRSRARRFVRCADHRRMAAVIARRQGISGDTKSR
jgi:hypothetical protein